MKGFGHGDLTKLTSGMAENNPPDIGTGDFLEVSGLSLLAEKWLLIIEMK